MRLTLALVVCLIVAVPAFARQHPPESATVNFGVLPTAPLGPAPCLQAGAIGGPADPCSYKIHHLEPGESVIRKGGEVTFHIRGGGHGFAIYEVSKDTTRDQVGQFLCPGDDPATIADPNAHGCNLSAANANARHVVTDGKDDVVLIAETNVTNAHPDNRVWSEPGRFMSAGGQVFLNGGTAAAPPGQLLTFRFQKSGRYLVICMNRVHFLNDWMFGFVDVIE
jgi:hypothetical protein